MDSLRTFLDELYKANSTNIFALIAVALGAYATSIIFRRLVEYLATSLLSGQERRRTTAEEELSRIRKEVEKEKDVERAGALREQERRLKEEFDKAFVSGLRREDGQLVNDWREPLIQMRERLADEALRLSARSAGNLAAGIATSFVASAALVLLLFVFPPAIVPTNWFSFIAIYGARFSIVVIIQILAVFFLRMYVINEREIARNKNEITNAEYRIAAALMIQADRTGLSTIAEKLASEERNFLLAKGERSTMSISGDTVGLAQKMLGILSGSKAP